jgi:IclR family acetate operon transcriptional repressor
VLPLRGTLEEVVNNSQTPVAQRRRRPKRIEGVQKTFVNGEQYQLKALARALDVLECFQDGETSLNLKEISALVDLPESSLFRILLTLKSQQYLLQNSDGSYRLPDKLLFGRLQERADRCRTTLRPYLSGLVSRFDETASAAYLFGDQVRVLDMLETYHEVRMTNRPGRVLPPHCSSLGKAITAFQEPALMERMIEVYGLVRRTEHSIVDRRALMEEYAAIRNQGYAFDRQETVLGGICIAAPVAGPDKRVVAAISVSTPLVRMTAERETEIRDTLIETARRASREFAEASAN